MANIRCAASRDLPLNTERSWDVDAARSRIFEWAGGSEDRIGPKAGRAFLVYDAEAPDSRDSYRLAFADVVDGKLQAIAAGVRQAAAQLPRLEGLSEACRQDTRDVLDGYLEKLHQASATEEERAAGGILLARMPLERGERAVRQPKSAGELDEDLLAQIHDPSVISDERLPYLNKAWASTDLVDTYFTRMMPSTLRNYADDASNGIAIQNSHRVDELSLGRTYRGTFKNGRSGTPARAEMDFYIPPGLRTSDVTSDDVINGIKWGTIKDVSVGFYGGELRCSICRKPMLDDIFYLLFFGGDDDRETVDPESPCAHLPGGEYWLRDKDGLKTDERATAIGEIENAHCAELSLVFDGATPQAQIKGRSAPVLAKATRMLEMGVLERSTALVLEQRYRARGVRFPDVTLRRFASIRASLEEASSTNSQDEPSAAAAGAVPFPAPAAPPEQSADAVAPTSPSASAAVSESTASQEVASMPEQPTDGAPAEGAARAASTAAPPAEPGGGTTTTTASPSSSSAATDLLPQLRAALVARGLAPEGFDGELPAIISRFAELGNELTDLRGWADIGRQARERLVESCKKAGVRAFGSNWSEAAYAPTLSRGTYPELTQLKEHLDKLGDERFPGGRASQDDLDPPPNGSTNGTTRRVPARAYQAR